MFDVQSRLLILAANSTYSRGKHALDSSVSGAPRCISCLLCFSICPPIALSLSVSILLVRLS